MANLDLRKSLHTDAQFAIHQAIEILSRATKAVKEARERLHDACIINGDETVERQVASRKIDAHYMALFSVLNDCEKVQLALSERLGAN